MRLVLQKTDALNHELRIRIEVLTDEIERCKSSLRTTEDARQSAESAARASKAEIAALQQVCVSECSVA
jgi:hypothetical protein